MTTIQLKEEQYKNYSISTEKIRGQKKYNILIIDETLKTKHELENVQAENKKELMNKIKAELVKIVPQKKGWVERKNYLEKKYNIEGLKRGEVDTRYSYHQFIFFRKGIKWQVKIENSGKTIISYEEYPYSKYKDMDWDERSRSQGQHIYNFKADLERQIQEALNRINNFKDIKKKMGTFGVNPKTIKSDVENKRVTTTYRGFDIEVEYLYNKTEREGTYTLYVKKDGNVITTDSISTRTYDIKDLKETIKRYIDKGKNYIAREIIYNMDKTKMPKEMQPKTLEFKERYSDSRIPSQKDAKTLNKQIKDKISGKSRYYSDYDNDSRMRNAMGEEEYKKRNPKLFKRD